MISNLIPLPAKSMLVLLGMLDPDWPGARQFPVLSRGFGSWGLAVEQAGCVCIAAGDIWTRVVETQGLEKDLKDYHGL